MDRLNAHLALKDNMEPKYKRIILTTPEAKVVAVDEPTHGGACHRYQVLSNRDDTVLCEVNFQVGPIREAGVNGPQHVDLLAIIRDRLDGFQSGPWRSEANEATRQHVVAAIDSENSRTRARTAAGTEGTSAA